MNNYKKSYFNLKNLALNAKFGDWLSQSLLNRIKGEVGLSFEFSLRGECYQRPLERLVLAEKYGSFAAAEATIAAIRSRYERDLGDDD